jgi:hypothetical protein
MAIKSILTLAMIVGIGYCGIKGCESADKFLKTHKSYSRVEPAYGYFVSRCNHEQDISEYEASLERIPDQIQDIVNDHDGRVYFYEVGDKYLDSGNSKENPKRLGFYMFWDPVRGVEKGIFVSCTNQDKKENNIALHEYGHAIDEFAGAEFFGKQISETCEMKRMCDEYSFRLDKYYRTPIEFFAKMTEEYYRTKQSRKSMKKEFPEMSEFYRELEKKAVKRGITSKRNIVSESVFDLLMVKTGIAPGIIRWLDKVLPDKK